MLVDHKVGRLSYGEVKANIVDFSLLMEDAILLMIGLPVDMDAARARDASSSKL